MPREPLRLLVVHESYVYRGGEDESVETDCSLLSSMGHQVERWSVSNSQIAGWSLARKTSLLWRTTWSSGSYRAMRQMTERFRPDLVHFHNTLPIISPAAIRAAHDSGIPVVMTLHNYRLMCPVATFLRDGRPCEECHTRSLARGVLHGCYRGSRIQTAAVAMMLATHRRLGTWVESVDAYVALTHFMRSKILESGVPDQKVHIRPNWVEQPGQLPGGPGRDAIFVGRLSTEKGIACLLEAVPLMESCRLRIVGTGPMEPVVKAAAESAHGSIEVLGQLPHDATLRLIAGARVLVFPSIWYEGLPRTIIEAFACGVPVVASRLGAMAEIVTDGHDGFLYTPGDAGELADRVRRLMSDDTLRQRMSRAARATHEARYSTQGCYEKLIEIYGLAIASAQARRRVA